MTAAVSAAITGHALDSWFSDRGWRIADFQREAWQAYLNGESGLIHAATGTGKTLAAWGGPLLEALSDPAPAPAVLWITPLRALAADLTGNLAAVAAGLDLDWRVESRTGDTSASRKTRQRSKLPEALVTTPESLSLLLSYAETQHQLRKLRAIVVDEWHELLGSKRGVQLELCLARLRHLNPALRIWGLSATLGNLDEARKVLLGPNCNGQLITANQTKPNRIDSLLPDSIDRFAWGGHLGTRLLPEVISALERANSTLLFTNTRSQAELWHQALLRERPDWLETIALHHGSLDRGLRDQVEAGLRAGDFRCVVCTSSLDLGVDFAPVEQVIQIGSPKGIARLLQRAGRSGHQPEQTSRVLCVPTHALELAEIAAARQACEAGHIEARSALRNCLDVLVQHLVTLALGGGFSADTVEAEIRDTWAFADISAGDWQWALNFISQGGNALQHYPEYRRAVIVDGLYRVPDRRIAQRHRMAIGTITSNSAMQVRWLKGGTIGTIEEAFITRLKPGDQFLFAGRLLQLVRVRDMTAYVRAARSKKTQIPRWQGGRMPLSTELAAGVQAQLLAAREGHASEPEMQMLQPLTDLQQRWSTLPGPTDLLVEIHKSREGHHLFLFPFAGRLAHEGLAALLAYRLGQQAPRSLSFSCNDYGVELLSPAAFELDIDQLRALLTSENLAVDLLAAINAAELARHEFREIARVAGLVFQGYPGHGKSARQLQASSGLLYDVLERFDPDNRLTQQARRELLLRQLESERLFTTLTATDQRNIVLTRPRRLTPLAFPLWAERQRERLTTESWEDRVRRMADQLEQAASDA